MVVVYGLSGQKLYHFLALVNGAWLTGTRGGVVRLCGVKGIGSYINNQSEVIRIYKITMCLWIEKYYFKGIFEDVCMGE